MAQERLSILHRLEVMDRFCLHTWSGAGPYHYVLGRAGAAVVAAERGVTVADLAWRRDTAAALAGHRQLAHLVGCHGGLSLEPHPLRPPAVLVGLEREETCARSSVGMNSRFSEVSTSLRRMKLGRGYDRAEGGAGGAKPTPGPELARLPCPWRWEDAQAPTVVLVRRDKRPGQTSRPVLVTPLVDA